ncbi:MAG: hypothetical protein AB1423_12205 [Pseudomonadota bacterium]
MNNYYIDSSVASSGDGTQNNPLKQISDFLSLSNVVLPFTLYLKRGSVFSGGLSDDGTKFYNTTSEANYIKLYGNGPSPVITATDDSFCLSFSKVRNLISDPLILIGSMVKSALASVSPCMISGDNNTNVWLNDWEFHSVGGRQQAWQPALWMSANNAVLGNAGYFGLNNPRFFGTSRGAWVMGISDMPADATDNNGDNYCGYGIRVTNPAFVDVGGDGIIMSNATSKEDPKSYSDADIIANPDFSGVVNPSFSSTRVDFQATASVNHWVSNCKKVFFIAPTTNGSIGSQYGIDKQSVDFDILCHNCLISGGYSRNASGWLLTSNYSAQVKAKPDGVTAFDWYYTQGWGNKNNTIRNSISFNDGCQGGRPKILLQGYTYNLMIENCVIIDTVSPSVDLILMFGDGGAMYPLTSGVYACVLTGVTFYAPNAASISLLHSGSDSGASALVQATGCNLYASEGITPVWPASVDSSANESSDPGFINLPSSSPTMDYAFANLL